MPAKKTRCKFLCTSVKENTNAADPYQTVTMRAEYDENDPEDTRFSKATPWGNIEFDLSNPAVLGMFEEGKSYFIDITPADQGDE